MSSIYLAQNGKMSIKFNIDYDIPTQFDLLVCNEFVKYLDKYYISLNSDGNKIIFKRKILYHHNYGGNMKYTMNLIKKFEILKIFDKIQIRVDIKPFIFTLALYPIIFVSLFFVLKFSVLLLTIMVVSAFLLTIISFLNRLNNIISIILKVFNEVY